MGMKTRERFCRAVDRRFHARIPLVLHQHRARLLAQSLRDSRRGRQQGQVDAEPARFAAGRKRARHSAVRDLEEEGKFIFFTTQKGT